MDVQVWCWMAGGAALLLAVYAGVAEHRRLNRDNLDDAGWVPWRGVQVAAAFGAIVALILGLKLG